MNTLKDLLDDVAEQAKPYDLTDRALAVARRRRRLARVAPVALAAAIAIGVAMVWLPLHRSDTGGDGAATVSWLPDRITVPKNAPPLPTDHGVAPASVVYLTGDKTVLVTEDGRQYQLPREWTGCVRGVSPDGRWLAIDYPGDKVLLRDLSGTGQLEIAVGDAGVATQGSWSADGRWFALWTAEMAKNAGDPDSDPRIITVDLDRRQQQTASISGNVNMKGVLDSGDVVLADRISPDQVTTPKPIQISFFDRQTRQVRDRYQIDPTPWLSTKERQARQTGGQPDIEALSADGGTLLLRLLVPAPVTGAGVGYVPDDVLAVDLNTGKLTRRYHLPDPHYVQSAKDKFAVNSWSLVSVLPEGLLYIHTGRTSPPSGPMALELLDLSTGRLQVVSTVSSGVANILVVRGGTG
jgi:hypothetical protein